MNDVSTPVAVPEARILVRGANLQLSEELRSSAVEKTRRLLGSNPRIQQVNVILERTPCSDPNQSILAKGEVMFGGPALLTSVTAANEAQALEFLLDRLGHQLRRQRTPRACEPAFRR